MRKEQERQQKEKLKQKELSLQLMEEEQSGREKLMHDMKHRIHGIRILLREGRSEEAQSYLDEMLGEMKRTSTERWCQSAAVNAVLNLMVSEAKEKGIRVETDIDVFFSQMDEMKLCQVFANLLENAIEAAEQAMDPWISLKIRREHGQLRVWLRNSLSVAPIEKGGRLLTTKEDKGAHGYGLQIVRDIVEKEWGTFLYRYDKFQFEVLLILI